MGQNGQPRSEHTDPPTEDEEPDSTERACDTLLMCIVTVMNHGLRNGGGVGDILRKPSKDVSNSALPLGPSQAAAGLPPSHAQPVSVTLSRVIGSPPQPTWAHYGQGTPWRPWSWL